MAGQTAKLQQCIQNIKAAPRSSPLVAPISVPQTVDGLSSARSRGNTRALEQDDDPLGTGASTDAHVEEAKADEEHNGATTSAAASVFSPQLEGVPREKPASSPPVVASETPSCSPSTATPSSPLRPMAELKLQPPASPPEDLSRYAVPSSLALPKPASRQQEVVKRKARSATSSPVGSGEEDEEALLSSSGSSDDIAEEIISDSDLTEIVPGLGGNIATLAQGTLPKSRRGNRRSASMDHASTAVPHVMAIHSECRPVRLQEQGRSMLKSFDAFKHVLQAQGLAATDAAAGAGSSTASGTKNSPWMQGAPSLGPADFTTRHTLAYAHSSKTPNRLSSGALEHQTARKLKKQKHHRRHSSLLKHEDGSTYVKAHPLVEPLHPIEKQHLQELVARKRGVGTVLHSSPTIDRSMYSDVCRMLARSERLLAEREEDLKLAGQIGEAILADNGKLEALVAELSTNLQAQVEEAEESAKQVELMQQKVEELTNINKALLEQQQQQQRTGIVMLPSVSSSASPVTSPAREMMRRESSTSSTSSLVSLGAGGNQTLSRDASELNPHTQVSAALAEFLREELETVGDGGNLTLSLNRPGSMRGPGATSMMSPSSITSPIGVHLPPSHSRSYSNSSNLDIPSLPSPAAQFSSSPSSRRALSSAFAATVPPEKLVEDLAAVARKLKRERRVAELEKANWAQAVASIERELRAKQSWVEAHQAEVEQALSVRKEKEELVAQLQAQAQKAQEDSLAASVETKLKMQQQKRQMEAQLERVEEELRAEREEGARAVQARNELAMQCEELQRQVELLQSQLRAAQSAAAEQKAGMQEMLQAKLESQALAQSHEQLAALTAQLKEELEKTVSEGEATVAARDASISALEAERSRLTEELEQVRSQLERAEMQATAQTAQHIEQLQSVSSGFERRLAEEKLRAAEQTERLLAEQRQSIEEQVEESRVAMEASLREQADAFLAAQCTIKLMAEEADLTREEIALRAAAIEYSPASGAGVHGRDLPFAETLQEAKKAAVSDEGGLGANPDEDKVHEAVASSSKKELPLPPAVSITSPTSSNASTCSGTASVSGGARSVNELTSPMSAGSAMLPSPLSTLSARGSSSANSAAVGAFNLSLPPLQLKFPATPGSASASSAAMLSSRRADATSTTQTTAPVVISLPIIVTISSATGNVVDATATEQQRNASPASRAQPMTSPLGGVARLVPHTSAASFAATTPPHHHHPRDFHAALSASPVASATSPLPPRASPSSASASQSDEQGAKGKKKSGAVRLLESANQHRLALLSSVGKALSVVTGITPTHARVGNTPPSGVGPTGQAGLVAAALSTAMTPQQARALPSPLASSIMSPAAAAGSSNSIYVLPTPSFAVSPSDQLSLAYLYRYMYATWVQAFEWLDSNAHAKPPLWIEDRVSGHCFSCQKHWTVVARRHHCRLCGALFCGTCSRFRVDMPSLGIMDPVRCCLRCFGAAQSMSMSNSLALWETPGTMQPPPEKLLGVFPSPQMVRKDDGEERKIQSTHARAPDHVDAREEERKEQGVELSKAAATPVSAYAAATLTPVHGNLSDLASRSRSKAQRRGMGGPSASVSASVFDLDSDEEDDEIDSSDSELDDIEVDDDEAAASSAAALALAAAAVDSSADEDGIAGGSGDADGGEDSDAEFARDTHVVIKSAIRG